MFHKPKQIHVEQAHGHNHETGYILLCNFMTGDLLLNVKFYFELMFPSCLVPPSFNSPSPDQVVVEGSADIILPCDVAGVPTPNITWTKVFANGSDSDVLFTGQPYEFSKNRNNAGTYRCKADNGIGSAINQTIDVTINCEYHYKQ